jgi:amidohydrolase
MKNLSAIIERLLPEVIELRHSIHSEPELAFECHLTAQKVLDKIKHIPNLEIKTNVATSGIIATLGKDKSAACVALRADMDALPIQEENNCSYKSKIPGLMHACGHDGHTACLVGAALALGEIQDDLPGPVKFIFQPAEEAGPGAKFMIDEGVLENPKVEQIYGLHGWPELDLGKVATKAGCVLASVDSFDLTIKGRGTHAAWPHTGIDPILVASHIVLALQSIAARFTDPLDSVVVAVSKFNAGTAHNVMPDQALLSGTIRTMSNKSREKVLALTQQISKQTASAYGAAVELKFDPLNLPPTVNDPVATELATQAARAIFESKQIDTNPASVMGGEDFAFFLEKIPGSFWFLGLKTPEQKPGFMLHTPIFDFPDAAVKPGMQMHCAIVQKFYGLI